MMANLIKKKRLNAKVIILDYTKKPRAKSDAFLEAFHDLYSDIITFVGEAEIEDVNLEKKSITYRTYKNYEDYEGTATTLNYEILNLIPIQKANPVIKMSKIQTKICARYVNSRLKGEKEILELPGNICYSLVGENPQEAIAVAHEVSYGKMGMKVKAFMNKTDGKYRSKELAEGAHEWYKNLIDEMFG